MRDSGLSKTVSKHITYPFSLSHILVLKLPSIHPTPQLLNLDPSPSINHHLIRDLGDRSSSAVQLVVDIRAVGFGLDLASQRDIVQLAVATALEAEALAGRLGDAQSTAVLVVALCLAGIGLVVLGHVLGNPTDDAIGEVVVVGVGSLAGHGGAERHGIVPEEAGAIACGRLPHGKGLAAGELGAVASGPTDLGVAGAGAGEGVESAVCVGCRQHAEGTGDGAAARGSGTPGRSGDGGCGSEANEGREGEELHVADVNDR